MILVDSSAWVEYLRATESAVHLELRGLIAGSADLAVTDPVIMEVVAGAREEERATKLRRLLFRFHHLPVQGLGDYEKAAAIYRECRRKGKTVRSLVDCLIAAVAMREGVTVLEKDRDFRVIAEHTDLRLHEIG